jgi:hypothetical protein
VTKNEQKKCLKCPQEILGCYFGEDPPSLAVAVGKFQTTGSACGQHKILIYSVKMN